MQLLPDGSVITKAHKATAKRAEDERRRRKDVSIMVDAFLFVVFMKVD
jgi:hypothetical protein